MKRLDGFSEIKWAKGDSIVPPGFESYCYLLHQMYMDPSVNDLEKLTEWPIGEISIDVSNCNPIKWKEMALAFDIKFDPNRWFDFDFPGGKWREATIGPKEGSLQLNEIQNLQPFLEPFTTTKRLLLYFGAMHSMINKFSLNSNAIYEGSFVDLIELMKEKKEDAPPNMSPELWWPEDRQWFVYSDYDVVVSIVGGPKRLIDELAKSKILECIPVRYEDINLVQRGWGIL